MQVILIKFLYLPVLNLFERKIDHWLQMIYTKHVKTST